MSLLFFHVYHQITDFNKKADPSETEEKIETLLPWTKTLDTIMVLSYSTILRL